MPADKVQFQDVSEYHEYKVVGMKRLKGKGVSFTGGLNIAPPPPPEKVM